MMFNAIRRTFLLGLAVALLATSATHSDEPKPFSTMYRCWIAAKCPPTIAVCTLFSGDGSTPEIAEANARNAAMTACNAIPVQYCGGVTCAVLDTFMRTPSETLEVAVDHPWKVQFKALSRKGNWYAYTASGRTLCEAYQNAREPVIVFVNEHECGVCRCCWQIVQYPCKPCPCSSCCRCR